MGGWKGSAYKLPTPADETTYVNNNLDTLSFQLTSVLRTTINTTSCNVRGTSSTTIWTSEFKGETTTCRLRGGALFYSKLWQELSRALIPSLGKQMTSLLNLRNKRSLELQHRRTQPQLQNQRMVMPSIDKFITAKH